MISVVVPVYKVEKYLDKCVQSILAQTYENFELILVDDGSPDNCPQMCDEYANRDKRVRVIHKENGGLSDARNTGVSIAEGDYVTFIDSDDYVNSKYLQILYDCLMQYNATMSAVNLEMFYENKPFKQPKVIDDNYVISGEVALCNMLYQKDLDTHAWALLLPIEIVKKYPFPLGKYHEDEYTTLHYYRTSEKVAVSRAKLYYYLQRNNSIMHTFCQSALDELDAADNLVYFCKNNANFALSAAESKKFSDYCQVLLSTKDLANENSDMYSRITEYIEDISLSILRDKKTRKKNKVAAALFRIGGVKLLRFVYFIQTRIK